jgi:DNA-nicking Smr family endonuclease
MSGRKKNASPEDEALFHATLKDARPLKMRPKVMPDVPRPSRVIVAQHQFPVEPQFQEEPAPGIGGHAEAHLRRGRLEPEARIDLHGFTQDSAYRALLNFLVRAQADGAKLVLVITGKGGVLRAQLPLWLGQPDLRPLVAGMKEAHARHGGGGAYYVLLRKPKRAQVTLR